jgi:hypothetical protein
MEATLLNLRPILNFTPRGKLLPLGAKLSPRGELCPPGVNFVPLGVKLSPGSEILCLPLRSSKK